MSLQEESEKYKVSFDTLYAALAYVIIQYGENNTVSLPLAMLEKLNGKEFIIEYFTDNIKNEVSFLVKIKDN